MTSTLAMGITANLRRVPTDCCSTIFVDCFLNPLFVTHESATLASKRKPKTKSHPPYKTLLLLLIITYNTRLANLGNGTCIPSVSVSVSVSFYLPNQIVLKNCSCHKTQLRDQLRIHLLRNPPPPTKMQIKNCDKACTVCDFFVVFFFFFKFRWNLSTDRSLKPLTIEPKLYSTDDWKNPSPAPAKTVERNSKQS
jgi:hypothetical protein